MRFENPLGAAALVFLSLTSTNAQTLPDGHRMDVVAAGLSGPTQLAFVDTDEVLVLQKAGKVMHVTLAGVVTTALDIQSDVSSGSERGLLGIAPAPDFASSGFVYLLYTANSDPIEHRIVRYHWNGATLTEGVLLTTHPGTPGSNHDGGILLFGPDGMLYAVVGDLNRNGLTENFVDSELAETAVVLRMNPADGSGAAGNPFAALPGWERIYAYGIRNCYGMTFDPITGDLWIAENGPGTYDEVTRIIPGANSGWERIMGPDALDPQNQSDLYHAPGSTYVDPAFSWYHTVAPTGIAFLDSCRWPADVRNSCIVATYKFGILSRFDMNSDRTAFSLTGNLADTVADNPDERLEAAWASGLGSLTHVVVGPDGYLYVARISPGDLVRLRPIHPMGDINRDEFVNGNDLLRFVNLLLGESVDPDEIAQGDFDGDGTVESDDVPWMVTSLLMPN